MLSTSKIICKSFLTSVFFVLAVTALTSGCSSRSGLSEFAVELAVKELPEQYGLVQAKDIGDYLISLEHKLTSAIPPERRVAVQMAILNTPEPLAVSAPDGTILISRGLVGRLDTEAEFVYVVSHEMAHLTLGHHGYESAPRTIELAADREALGIMALAGFDPRSSIRALGRNAQEVSLDPSLHPSLNGTISAQDYPSFEERVNFIKSTIMASSWRPPAIEDRREFQKFRTAVIR